MIAGFTKVSYVDYPGELASVLFLAGCNFKCPWCHNKTIVNDHEMLDRKEVINQLIEKHHLVNHVVVTGGEPTIYGYKLILLLEELKKHDFLIKLDTNGTDPVLLKKIFDLKLVDYVAMDIKNIWDKYELSTNTEFDMSLIKKSIELIEDGGVDYQFRTTCNATMHTKADIEIIKGYIKDPTKYKLQDYRYSNQQLVDQDYGSVNFIEKDKQ